MSDTQYNMSNTKQTTDNNTLDDPFHDPSHIFRQWNLISYIINKNSRVFNSNIDYIYVKVPLQYLFFTDIESTYVIIGTISSWSLSRFLQNLSWIGNWAHFLLCSPPLLLSFSFSFSSFFIETLFHLWKTEVIAVWIYMITFSKYWNNNYW